MIREREIERKKPQKFSLGKDILSPLPYSYVTQVQSQYSMGGDYVGHKYPEAEIIRNS